MHLQALAPGGKTELNAETLEAIADEAPSAQLTRGEVVGNQLAAVLASTKLQPSKSAGKRLIQVPACCRQRDPLNPLDSERIQAVET